ncbi:hypothetical protein [Thermithiobacillus plumbiphilus]|uniref:Uncharacterized protein n=1 Tax=Thermithiobacillus plumbiphilus TaxID=1729899 RepID=A0ABU9DAD2_9PROT
MSMANWITRDLAQIKEAACVYAEEIGRPWILFDDRYGAALADTPEGMVWEQSGAGGPETQGMLLFPDYASVQDLIHFRGEELAGARPMHIRDWPVHGEPGQMMLQIEQGAYLEGAQRMTDAVQVRILPWSVENGVPSVLMLDARLNFVAPEEPRLQ